MKHVEKLTWVFVLSVILFVLRASVSSADRNCSFTFPNDTSSRTLQENTTLVLPFKISCTNVSVLGNFSIRIAHEDKRKGPLLDYCRIYQFDNTCIDVYQNIGCKCSRDYLSYRFEKNVNRQEPIWRFSWETDKSLRDEVVLSLNITYPAEVKELQVVEITDLNKPVDVVCLMDNGNPPVTARLLDKHGEALNDSVESGEIQYRFPAVGCQDAGLIRCEAPGASHNKTATLLVKCSPSLTYFTQSRGTNEMVTLKVNVTSYSTNIQCKLSKLSGYKTSKICRSPSFTGTPPDLTLTVRLDNVSKEEEGLWRLELTNDAGTGHLDFPLAISDKTATSSTEPATSTFGNTGTKDPLHVYHEVYSARVDFTVFGSVAVAAIAFTVTVITVSVIRYKKGGRNNELQSGRNHEQPEEMREPVNMEIQEPLHHQPGTESSPSNQSVHSYFEIPDETPPSSPEPPRRCLSPALPNDYLHPSVSHDVTEGTDEAKNVAPLYENTELRSLSQNTSGAASCGNDSEM